LEDSEIVNLFWMRDESAITHTAVKYGRYCFKITNNILSNIEDAEECVNDTYLRTWNSIPTNKPEFFSSYLGKIARNLAISKYKSKKCLKRGGGSIEYALEELEECIPSKSKVEDEIEEKYFTQALNHFLYTISHEESNVFLRRYWYADSINDVCEKYLMSESKVKSMLYRTRKKLKKYLERMDII
jgi:RNA polymerase sigma-70 factor (ECF subfamily)